ncbi:MAG: hypothetical protein ABL886_10945 [Rhodoglobus sp.]
MTRLARLIGALYLANAPISTALIRSPVLSSRAGVVTTEVVAGSVVAIGALAP